MVSISTPPHAIEALRQNLRTQRLAVGLTQAGLAERSGVPLPTLRKFERCGAISLESFVKLLAILDMLEKVTEATAPEEERFASIDDVLKDAKKPARKKGWRS